MKIIRSAARAWNAHTHSKYSANDALPSPSDIVEAVAAMGQRAIGLTDHGNMAGSVQLYKSAVDAGIRPFPGTELYVVADRSDTRAKRHHMCVLAYTTEGYRNLIRINSIANRNFHYKPLIGFSDLAGMSESGLLNGVIGTSGCFFGYIGQALDRGDDAEARRLVRLMDKWFNGSFRIELQNHNIVHDSGVTDNMVASELLSIARELGVPVILTQDAHYLYADERQEHDTLKRLASWGDDPDDAVFPGDGFHLANDEWFESHHDRDRYEAGIAGLEELIGMHDLSIPELDTYSYNIPFTVADPYAELVSKTMMALGGKHLPRKYSERLESELEIVRDTGMAGYLLLVSSVTDWCRSNKIFYQARGSASGSIICWLLGITQIDPIKHDLRFERFISRDRKKPPDIDLDVERSRRDELIAWLGENYSVMQIGTWMKMGLTDDHGNGRGSLLRKYFTMAYRSTGRRYNEWSDIPQDDRDSLRLLAEHSPMSAHGTHAAGLIITTTSDELDRLVPSMRIGTKSDPRFVSQYEMNDVEAIGLVKLDVLGLATLEVLNKCMQNLGRDVADGLDWIPTNDRMTYAMISKGMTDGVFQLEGGAARRGVRELKPTKLDDVIASMALFRPATMNSGATGSFIRRKHKEEEIPQRSEIIHRHTVKTYGIMLYQEQTISILRDLGMSPDDLTSFLKAVKASNANIGDAGMVIEGYRAQVQQMAAEHGIAGDEWDWLWDAIKGFSAYGFNKSHAAAYGLTSYRCAYLIRHHPTEFFAALLNVWAGTPKEQQYMKAARERGIRIRGATVNDSDYSYRPVGDGIIRKGLLSVDGIASTTAGKIIAARPEGGFTSMQHFCELLPSISGARNYLRTKETDSGVINKMVQGGLFDAIGGRPTLRLHAHADR